MKILKPPTNVGIQKFCTGHGNGGKGCGALLEVERDDLRFYKGGGYFDRDPAVLFKCPCCGQITDLTQNEWPRNASSLTPFTTEWRDS